MNFFVTATEKSQPIWRLMTREHVMCKRTIFTGVGFFSKTHDKYIPVLIAFIRF